MNQYNQVKVELGDTLWEIASEYGPADMDVRQVVHEICQLNDITAGQLEAHRTCIFITCKREFSKTGKTSSFMN